MICCLSFHAGTNDPVLNTNCTCSVVLLIIFMECINLLMGERWVGVEKEDNLPIDFRAPM